MSPGTPAWVARALAHWVAQTRNGLAWVTYRSHAAREQTIRELESAFASSGISSQVVRCASLDGSGLVEVLKSSSNRVLQLTDQELLFFGGVSDDPDRMVVNAEERFRFNFSREMVTNRPGNQIWWFTPEGAVQFAQRMPDLARFFPIRYSLEVLPGVGHGTAAMESVPFTESRNPARQRAADLLSRAMHAATVPQPDAVQIWTELAAPAVDELLGAGLGAEALDAFKKLQELLGDPSQTLLAAATEDPDRAVAAALGVLGALHARVGRTGDARIFFAAAIRVVEVLIGLEPGSAELQLGLIVELGRLADVEFPANVEEARRLCERMREVSAGLVASQPDNLRFLRAQGLALNKLGRLDRIGDTDKARKVYFEALSIFQRLAALDPDNPDRLRELAVSYLTLADVDLPMDLERARQGYQAALSLFRMLVANDPDNTTFLRDLAIVLERMADLDRPGDSQRTRAALVEAFDIRELLVKKEPSNRLFVRQLALAHLRLGDLDLDHAPDSALLRYRNAERILRKIANNDVEDLHRRKELALVLRRVASTVSDPVEADAINREASEMESAT